MKKEYDIIIIGAGPAGVSASLYTKRAGMSTLIIGQEESSLFKAEKIENYYGIQPITGKELFENGLQQAENIGVDILNQQVVDISWDTDYTIKTPQEQLLAKAVIIATGIKRNAPKIQGLKEFEGRGISFCAVCDGFFYKGKDVCVIGNGEYALEEAIHLKNIASKVTVLTNGEPINDILKDFDYIQEKITKIDGEQSAQKVIFEDGKELAISGAFIAIGTAGAADFAKKLGAETEGNYIKVDETSATNLPGLYAAGDTAGGLLQVAKAVHQGAEAGTSCVKYIRGLKK